ncbi:MAG TPA: transposase [Terriglobales bacterium]|nr:transposase [Terriglobales bacterium]
MATPKHRSHSGSSYFVTTKCWQGRTIFQVPENAEILINTLFHYRDRNAYLLHEFVVMPDHLHLLLTPDHSVSLEEVMQLIKGGSSHRIHKARHQKMEIWQVGFHDWTVRDASDWQSKAEYIATNPVRAGLVNNFKDWPYSSASGRFALDSLPLRFSMASGAKARNAASLTPGLKPRPSKETNASVDGSQ